MTTRSSYTFSFFATNAFGSLGQGCVYVNESQIYGYASLSWGNFETTGDGVFVSSDDNSSKVFDKGCFVTSGYSL